MKIPKLNANTHHDDDDFLLTSPQTTPPENEAEPTSQATPTQGVKRAPRRKKNPEIDTHSATDATSNAPSPAPSLLKSPEHDHEPVKNEKPVEIGGVEAFVLTPEEEKELKKNDPLATPRHSSRLTGLSDYSGTDTGRQIHYSLSRDKWNGKPADVVFVDDRERITVFSNSNENATLAAMQLAAHKWGAIRIDGNQKYVDTCVRLAAEFSIPVSNPELQDRIQKLRLKNEDAVHFSRPKKSFFEKSEPFIG